MKTIRVWSARLPNISAPALMVVQDQTASRLVAEGSVKPIDVLDGDITVSPPTGSKSFRVWDSRFANLPPAHLTLLSDKVDQLVSAGIVKATDLDTISAVPSVPAGALLFSDNTPLQFSDGSYLELAA